MRTTTLRLYLPYLVLLTLCVGPLDYALGWLPTASLQAQPLSYPANAEVVVLTEPPYNLDPTGVVDAAPGINLAFLENNDEHAILYLPAGTYRLSGKVQWGEPPGCQNPGNETCQRYTVLAGAGENATLLKLDDNHPDFQTTTNFRGEPLLNTGSSAAMSFENSLRHLTVSTGSGNPAATGVTFMANNNGGLTSVTIRSEDGQGVIGLNMWANEQNGPLLAEDVTVSGFDYGVYAYGNQNGLVFEGLTLSDQNLYGLYNQQQVTTVRQLTSVNAVTAVYNQGDGGSTLTLIDSDLQGVGAASSAIAIRNINRRQLFVRNVTTSGYQLALQQFQNGFSLETLPTGYIDEYTTADALRACDNLTRSLNLPIVEAPVITYADTSTWVSVATYGAAIDNGFQGQGSPQDDTPAFLAALNSGAATIVIPSPGGQFPLRYILYGDIVIPPTVKHIIGAKAAIGGAWRFVTDAGADPLTIEDFAIIPAFAHNSARTLHARHMTLKEYTAQAGGGAGDVFFEDVNGGPFVFRQQTVYARQLNPEIDTTNVINDGGLVWIFGMKVEKKGTLVRTINGGQTEVFGAFAYATIPEASPPNPMFEVVESSLSVNGLKSVTYINAPYDIILRETRNGVTNELIQPNVVRADLLVAYVSPDPNVAPTVSAGNDQVLVPPSMATTLTGAVNDDANLSGDCFVSRTWMQLAGPSLASFVDASDPATAVTFPEAGKYVLRLAADDGAFTVADTTVVYVFDNYSTTLDHNQDGSPSGTGADARLVGWGAYLNNYGAAETFAVRNYTSFPNKAIVRIDRSAFTEDLSTVLLELEVSTTNTGLIEPWTYNVFGLNDGNPGESWVEGTGTGSAATGAEVTYDNAPGNVTNTPYGGAYDPNVTNSGGVVHAETTFLGTYQLRQGRREKVFLESAALAQFVNADTDGQLTFLITRVESANNSITFASKEHPTFAAPRLYYDFKPAVLPVDLLSLSAKPVLGNVEVRWRSVNETALGHYAVQRREARTGRFETIGKRVARGDGAYRFTHDQPGAGTHYYRLASVDKDGARDYSQVVSATIGDARGGTLVAYPNPVAQGEPITLRLQRPLTQGMAVELHDSAGRLLRRLPHDGDLFRIDTDALTPGVYTLTVGEEHLRGIVK